MCSVEKIDGKLQVRVNINLTDGGGCFSNIMHHCASHSSSGVK